MSRADHVQLTKELDSEVGIVALSRRLNEITLRYTSLQLSNDENCGTNEEAVTDMYFLLCARDYFSKIGEA